MTTNSYYFIFFVVGLHYCIPTVRRSKGSKFQVHNTAPYDGIPTGKGWFHCILCKSHEESSQTGWCISSAVLKETGSARGSGSYDRPNVKFYQGRDQSGETCSLCFAFRPGLSDALEQWSKMYDLYVCTMGIRSYANAVLDIIDPDDKLFHRRMISTENFTSDYSK